MSVDTLECDLLVIGAGMAGLSAAGWAAEHGANVVVVEKAAEIGGSAALSGGMLWTASSPERMQLYGGGPRALGDVVCQNYPAALAWLRRRGVDVSQAMKVLHGYGYQIDILAHLSGCVALVEQHGGHVVFETETEALLTDPRGRVIGARTSHPDGKVDVLARSTLLATGGFQGSADMRARYIHPNARDMLLRSNPCSRGDGLKLGRQAGGEVAGINRGFYGHLVSESKAWGEQRLFTMLSQYHSDHTLLLNEDGLRFCDETAGDHTNTYHTVMQKHGRALCFWDARVQAEHATQPIVSIAPPMDRMAVALEHGGKGIVAQSLEELAEFATAQGFDGEQVRQSILAFNELSRSRWETLDPPRSEVCLPLDQSPFYALVVHPAITFTFGGLTIDPEARVLRSDGTPVAGLLAAGSDAGGAFGIGYAGGLALAMTYGLVAARTAGRGPDVSDLG
ncbi:MAG TPA: FAD-dependent oxidoreductase [Burkholderiaceae bacterium]|jgi:succinate dehydrogenase/fumarate reductase flavoprotein subunit